MNMNNDKQIIPKDTNKLVSWRALAQSSSKSAREIIPYEFAKNLNILPISLTQSIEAKELIIAISNKHNSETEKIEILSQLKLITNLQPRLIETDDEALSKAISLAYFKNIEELMGSKKNNSGQNDQTTFKRLNLNNDEVFSDTKSSKHIPRLLSIILNNAYANLASDIHLDSKKNGLASISYRSSGRYKNINDVSITEKEYDSLIRYIKILCNLDITEHKKPQEGMFECKFHEFNIRIRVSIIPSLYGVKIALRILHHYLLDELQKKPDNALSCLGLSETQEEIFKQKIKQKGGLILISGPTGSGKSTLLYSLIESATPKDWNIISLEDPVEREIPSITQIEVKSDQTNAYLNSFKSLLRQDPDMILISEIRDNKVLETAIQAALSGILVLSTIHASRTLELILRLFELGCTPVTLGAVLKLTSSQRLIPKNCKYCSIETFIEDYLYSELFIPKNTKLIDCKGCNHCNFQKCSGLVAVYESCCPTLPLISKIYSSFKEGMDLTLFSEIKNEFQKTHFSPFQVSIKNLLLLGEISPSTALLFLN